MRALLVALALCVLVLPAQAGRRIPLHSCLLGGTHALCGTFRTPENRARPGGRSIALKVAVLRATGRPVAHDPLIYLAGGPGGAATEIAGWVSSVFAGVNVHRDIVLVDQRGTGSSGRLVCPPVPPAVVDAPSLAAYTHGCETSLRADFTRYGTVAAMDDVDAVIKALGYRKVKGWSRSSGRSSAASSPTEPSARLTGRTHGRTSPRSSSSVVPIPRDPIDNIAAIRATMPRARIVVAPSQGHGVGQLPCLSNLVARFVARGTASGLATGCVRRISPTPFRTD